MGVEWSLLVFALEGRSRLASISKNELEGVRIILVVLSSLFILQALHPAFQPDLRRHFRMSCRTNMYITINVYVQRLYTPAFLLRQFC